MSRFFRLKMQKFLVTMSCTETGIFILQIANLKIFFVVQHLIMKVGLSSGL